MTHDSSTAPSTSDYKVLLKTDPATFAQSIGFLDAPTKATTNNTIGAPSVLKRSDDSDASTTHKIGNLFTGNQFYRVHGADTTNDYPKDDQFVKYSDDRHLFPKVFIFDYSATAETSGYLVTLAGKVIESIDIDGHTVGLPNTWTPLGVENALFADSALPYNLVQRRTVFNPAATTKKIISALVRAPALAQSRHPASTLLVDRTQVILPRYEPTQNDTTGNNFFAGLTQVNNVTWLRHVLRFIGFHTASPTSPDYDTIPGCGTPRQLLAWSPYSFTSAEDEDSLNSPSPDKLRRYFIMNGRSIFGSDIKLVQCKNAIECLPL